MATITQKEAREYRARAAKLEKLIQKVRAGWLEDWPVKAKFIGRVDVTPVACAQVETAKRLGHAITITVDNGVFVLWADALRED
jgi:hypothetical protein